MSGLSNSAVRRIACSALALAASGLWAGQGMAQTAASAAPPTTREEIQRGQLEERLRTEGQSVVVDGALERAPCPLAAPQFAGLRFTFAGAQFSGLEAVDPGIVQPAFADLIGKDLSVAAICDIRDRAGTLLRQRGYLAAVQVPVQQIDGGVVRFDVVLARMSDIQVRGEPGPSGAQLQKYIAKLIGQPVFNISEAERYLLLARDIPGLDVRLVLEPAPSGGDTRPGDVVGVFNVARTPVYAEANIQNFGSRAVGRFGGLARVRFNGLTGLGDETTLSVYAAQSPKEQKVLQIGHQFQLGSEGLRLGASGTFAWSRPDVVGDDLFDTRTTVVSAYAVYPIQRRQTSNLFVSAGFDLINQDVDFSGLQLSMDRLRVAYARLDFNRIDGASLTGQGGYSAQEPRFALLGSVEIRQGLDVFGASKACGAGFAGCVGPGVVPISRLDADPTGLVLRADAQLDFRPSPLIKFSLKPRVQYSPDALLGYEQISGGNYTSGRGFDPGAVIGDSGYGLQTELAYGSLMPKTPGGIALQPYAFVDVMRTDSRNVAGNPDTISSAGGGLRATLGRQASLDIFGAVPLQKAPFQTGIGDVRLLVNLSVQLAPWHR